MVSFGLPLIPEQASTVAWKIDLIYWTLVGLSAFFSIAVFAAAIFLAIKYRKGSKADRSRPLDHSTALELVWSIIPLIMALGVFGWASYLYFDMISPPANAMEVYVVGKQWMWKIQHPTGQREINELHVPVGQPVKLVMTSQDVLHDFSIPAFRIKQDVVPGRYREQWFEATKPGAYHIFCAEYCGTEHSRMIGTVYVMEQADYEAWLQSGTAQESMAQAGARLFQSYGCSGCHGGNGSVRAPLLNNVFGRPVPLANGETVIADDMYIRDSILQPKKQVVGGFEPVMPTYQGQISEDDLMQIAYYIKSLK